MSDTFLDNLIYNPFAGGNPKTELGKIGDSSIYPGFAIRVVDSVIYLAQASDLQCSGVMALKRGMAVDVAYTANDFASYFPKGFGAIVWIYIVALSPVTAIEPGDEICLSATDGLGRLYIYTDAAAATDSLESRIGIATGDIAGSKTANELIKVVI